MHLIMKAKSDKHHINLLIINKMIVILSDEYDQLCFYDIVICSYHIKGTQHDFLQTVHRVGFLKGQVRLGQMLDQDFTFDLTWQSGQVRFFLTQLNY